MQQLLLKQVPACFSLKCEVLSELGRCQRYLARPKLELQAYERAMQVYTQGQRSSERYAVATGLESYCDQKPIAL